MIKMHCMLCKQQKELTIDDLKETAKFVRDNELDSEGYEHFIETKVGKKCKGLDNKAEKLKWHKYMIDEEDLKTIGDTVNGIKAYVEGRVKYTDRVLDIDNSVVEIKRETDKKVAELTKEKTEIQEKLPAIEEIIKEGREKLVELVGDDREELWVKKT